MIIEVGVSYLVGSKVRQWNNRQDWKDDLIERVDKILGETYPSLESITSLLDEINKYNPKKRSEFDGLYELEELRDEKINEMNSISSSQFSFSSQEPTINEQISSFRSAIRRQEQIYHACLSNGNTEGMDKANNKIMDLERDIINLEHL
ncbi:19296_t:CDS:2 [Dentiscutata erythropus]|uniref:19296_t:CDS:1 n=1 Tax=Dentiscutata erythropus TaxID=1348616 RepID=A0A9N8VHG7_9GLOM|nr:19296_t:CDS:2 [Dentiscutata erythropus]